MSKNITIGIPWDKDNPKPGFGEIYEKIADKLILKGYKIKEKFIGKKTWDQKIDIIASGKCDTAIDAFYVIIKRFLKVNFTTTVGMLIPKIIYIPELEKQETTRYLFYLMNIWRRPIIYLFILALIISLILRFGNNKSYKKYGVIHSFYHSLAGFLGQTGGILSDGYRNLNSVAAIISAMFGFLTIYLFTIYIQASTTAKSVKYFNDTNKLERTIQNERILAIESKEIKKILEDNGAIVVTMTENPNVVSIFDYYEKNRKRLKLSGFYYGDSKYPKLKDKALEYNYKVSKLHLGSQIISFPVNKKKTQLLKDLNIIILNLSEDNTLFHICSKYADQDFIIC